MVTEAAAEVEEAAMETGAPLLRDLVAWLAVSSPYLHPSASATRSPAPGAGPRPRPCLPLAPALVLGLAPSSILTSALSLGLAVVLALSLGPARWKGQTSAMS